MPPAIAIAQKRTCLIVSQNPGFISQMQGLVGNLRGETYVATSWWEANRLGAEGMIDMVVWDPEMEAEVG